MTKKELEQLIDLKKEIEELEQKIAQIEQMCERVVWLEDHKIRMVDTAAVVCEAYREYWNQH